MIPRLIHRIWLDDPMPDQVAANGREWARLHPDWTVVNWQATSALPPLANQDTFDQAAAYYPADWKRFRADLVRLEILRELGGVYADTDTVPRRSLDPLLQERSCVVAYSPQHIRGEHPITNCVMAAAPNHSFIGDLVDQLPDALAAYGHRPLAQSIGPWHLTRTYQRRFRDDVIVLDSEDMFGDQGWVEHYWNNGRRRRGEATW
ncbi:glycosyltransferase family 32 protein [Streptomonospora litoralis]|uniref:Glycosyltransferase sugar-binding region containing DXD motif protein n=1 Tax=Streptomonospora litoralis TaxID=2498135 RepID=A0A4P6Q7L5_9ACTN|nr:glycosyltransferase [Streptomonospora litoralis]QBI56788.1 Glycosyltransferase sugar-binding region containing DXD motif protein [Streptomonospora litoralis]